MTSPSRSTRRRRSQRGRCHRQQPVDELALSLQYLLLRDLGREPLRAVDLRKARPAAALRRPFQLKRIRPEGRRIEVTLEREGGDDLAARLRDLAERPELAAWPHSGLFLEFTQRDFERILRFGIFPLRDRPGAEVLPGPERAARMHQQELEALRAPPIHQNAGAPLWHNNATRWPRRSGSSSPWLP